MFVPSTPTQRLKILLALILILSSFLGAAQPAYALAGPPNVVTNADFATDLSSWTSNGFFWCTKSDIVCPGSGFDPFGLTGVADGITQADNSTLSQCVRIVTPPSANTWNASYESGVWSGATSSMVVDFFGSTATDCTGTPLQTSNLNDASKSLSNIIPSDTIKYIKVTLICGNYSPEQTNQRCFFDNIFVGGVNATPVNLVQLSAKSLSWWDRLLSWFTK